MGMSQGCSSFSDWALQAKGHLQGYSCPSGTPPACACSTCRLCCLAHIETCQEVKTSKFSSNTAMQGVGTAQFAQGSSLLHCSCTTSLPHTSLLCSTILCVHACNAGLQVLLQGFLWDQELHFPFTSYFCCQISTHYICGSARSSPCIHLPSGR